jgi:peptidoglycan hydrolase CwlO-like protein
MHIGGQNIQDVLTADNMNETLILLISNTLTALGAWFVGKRKVSAETDNTVLRNLELSINLYAQIIRDLKTEIDSLNLKIQDLEKKVDELHAENKKLKQTSSVKITK